MPSSVYAAWGRMVQMMSRGILPAEALRYE
jgi:hypothetical protein